MRNTIERLIYNKMESKDFGESMCNETKLKVLRWVIQQLKQHGVMQAEGSDGVKEAAVGNSAAGQSGSDGCKRTALCDANPTFGYCSHCGGRF
jgi:hypothetical protein